MKCVNANLSMLLCRNVYIKGVTSINIIRFFAKNNVLRNLMIFFLKNWHK